jgi:hypothetical protein
MAGAGCAGVRSFGLISPTIPGARDLLAELFRPEPPILNVRHAANSKGILFTSGNVCGLSSEDLYQPNADLINRPTEKEPSVYLRLSLRAKLVTKDATFDHDDFPWRCGSRPYQARFSVRISSWKDSSRDQG